MLPSSQAAAAGSGSSAAVVEESVFRLLVDLEVAKAARLQYPVSVVCLAPGGRESRHPSRARRAAEAARRTCRATDVLSVDASSRVCLLLVDAEASDLPHIVRRASAELSASATGEPPDAPAAWCAGGSSYPGSATTGLELLSQAARLSDLAAADGSGSLRLPG